MTYAYTYVKMWHKDFNNVNALVHHFMNTFGLKKLDKQFLKYFGMYWMVREEL